MRTDLDHPQSFLDTTSAIQLADLLDLTTATPDQIRELRHTHVPFGLRSFAEAEALFAFDRSAGDKPQPWSDLFIELVTDFVVWGRRPTGVLDTEHAKWLTAQVDLGTSENAIALLVNIVEEAHLIPSWFEQTVRSRAIARPETQVRAGAVRKAA